MNPAVLTYHARTGAPLLNWYLYAYGLAAACLYVAGQFLAAPRDRMSGISLPPVFRGLGTILVFLLLNLEIADYFGRGDTLVFELSGNFARDMTYTIAWSIFALGLVVAGMLGRSRRTRYCGLGLLGVALVKLFLIDLAQLNQLYRIGAFAGVAVIAITASALYQRFLATPRGESPKK
jgi:uncharacterized membrane protein